MPEVELMGWNTRQRRWFKKYKGKVFAVSPKQLGTEPTKAASRKAANDWWEKKQAQIDATLNARKHPSELVWHYEKAIENHRIYAKWYRNFDASGDLEKAEKSEAAIEILQEALRSDAPPFPLSNAMFDPAYEERLDTTLDALWWERRLQVLKSERQSESVAVENTIRGHIDQYLEFRQSKTQTGKNKLGTYQTFRHRLNVFRKWVDPALPLDGLNEELWERFYLYLASRVQKQEMEPGTMSSVLCAGREFVRSRWERRLIELPRNLTSRALAVSAPLSRVETFTKEELKARFKEADERMRLFALLALNCGFYSVDIGTLKQSEVDWENGRIQRKRTKTRGRSENVPTVDYLLWQETFNLLKKHRVKEGELALLNADGKPLWHEYEKDNGKYVKSDAVKCLYFRLQATQLEIPNDERKPFKTFRKTASSKLDDHIEYGRYAEYFLGEAPRSIAGRHYIQPSREQFDNAVKWLREQFSEALQESAKKEPEPESPKPKKCNRREPRQELVDRDAIQERIVELKKQGKKVAEIMAETGVSRTTVLRTLDRLWFGARNRKSK